MNKIFTDLVATHILTSLSGLSDAFSASKNLPSTFSSGLVRRRAGSTALNTHFHKALRHSAEPY